MLFAEVMLAVICVLAIFVTVLLIALVISVVALRVIGMLASSSGLMSVYGVGPMAPRQ